MNRCLRCWYRWHGRSARPSRCPRCSCRSWDDRKWVLDDKMSQLLIEAGIPEMLWAGEPLMELVEPEPMKETVVVPLPQGNRSCPDNVHTFPGDDGACERCGRTEEELFVDGFRRS